MGRNFKTFNNNNKNRDQLSSLTFQTDVDDGTSNSVVSSSAASSTHSGSIKSSSSRSARKRLKKLGAKMLGRRKKAITQGEDKPRHLETIPSRMPVNVSISGRVKSSPPRTTASEDSRDTAMTSSSSSSVVRQNYYEHDITTAYNMGLIHYSRNSFKRAHECFQKSYAAVEAIHGKDHYLSAPLKEKQGEVALKLGDSATARQCFMEALAVATTAPSTVTKSDSLSVAVPGVKERVEVLQQQLPAEKTLSPSSSVSENEHSPTPKKNTAVVSPQRERHDKFGDLLRHSDGKIGLIDDNDDVAASYANLHKNRYYVKGMTLFKTGDYSAAKIQFEKAYGGQGSSGDTNSVNVKNKKHHWGHHHHHHSTSDNNSATTTELESKLIQEKIGDCAVELGNFTEAQIHYNSVLRALRPLLGDKSSLVARVVGRSATAYLSQGKYSFAQKGFAEALAVQRRWWGNNHEVVVKMLKGLVMSYEGLGKEARSVEERKEYFESVREVLRPYLVAKEVTNDDAGDGGGDKSGSLYWNGDIYFQSFFAKSCLVMGDEYQKVHLTAAAMQHYQMGLGVYHDKDSEELINEFAILSSRLANLYEEKDDDVMAISYYEKSLEFQSQVTKEEGEAQSDLMSKTMYRLSMLYYEQDNDDKALPLFEAIKESFLPHYQSQDEHDTRNLFSSDSKQNLKQFKKLITVLKHLSTIYTRQHNHENALKCLKERIRLLVKYSSTSTHATNAKLDIAESFHRAGCLLTSTENYDEAAECHQQVLAIKKQMKDSDVALTMKLLGYNYANAERYDKAVDCFLECLTVVEDEVKVGILIKMGHIYNKQMAVDKAIGCYEECLDNPYFQVFSTGSDEDDNKARLQVIAYNNLANSHFESGDHDEAVKYYEKAHRAINIIAAPTSTRIMKVDIATEELSLGVFYNIGLLHLMRGSFEKAQICLSEFLLEEKSLADRYHMDSMIELFSTAANNMGNAEFKLGNYERAIRSYKLSVQMKDELQNKRTHTDVQQSLVTRGSVSYGSKNVLGVLYNLGAAYSQVANLNAALECYERALTILGPEDSGNDIKLAMLHHKIGNVHTLAEDFTAARHHYQKSFRLKQDMLDNYSVQPQILLTRHALALMFCRAGQLDHGKELLDYCYERAQETRYAELGKLLLDLSSVNLIMGNYVKAKQYCVEGQKQLKEMKLNLPENHSYIKQTASILKRIQKMEWESYKEMEKRM